MNEIEALVMSMLVAGENPVLSVLREQLRVAGVRSRKMTGVGFFTDFSVPDTGSWDLFETMEVTLPPLPAGRNVFAVLSTAPHSVTNLDCFILVRGDVEEVPVALRRVHIADSESGRLYLRTTPNARLDKTPEGELDIYFFLH